MIGMDSVVVSVRIKREVKQELERDGVNVEQFVKDALILRAKQAKLKEAVKKMTELIKKNMKPSKAGEAERMIREDRDAGHRYFGSN